MCSLLRRDRLPVHGLEAGRLKLQQQPVEASALTTIWKTTEQGGAAVGGGGIRRMKADPRGSTDGMPAWTAARAERMESDTDARY
ncbi:MAG: hypothetical protein Q8M37_11265 [Nevskia sp.]|nr:hypothetical protein [Nevskia sp.]